MEVCAVVGFVVLVGGIIGLFVLSDHITDHIEHAKRVAREELSYELGVHPLTKAKLARGEKFPFEYVGTHKKRWL